MKSSDQNSQDQSDTPKDINTAKQDKPATDKPDSDKKVEEESNEGVKILQEVFDTKASVSSTGASEDASSTSSKEISEAD